MWKSLSFQRNNTSIELKHVVLYSISHAIFGLMYSEIYIESGDINSFYIQVFLWIFLVWSAFWLFFTAVFSILSLELLSRFDFAGRTSFYISLFIITLLNISFSTLLLYSWSGWVDGISLSQIMEICAPFVIAALITALT